jgi:hypothetical protein
LAESHDLDPFLQRRRLDIYEQSVARQGYAYGVDVRRSRWLARASLGNAAVRAVDRGWSRLAGRLREEVLDAPGSPIAPGILDELSKLRTLLRAPRPALHLLTRAASNDGSWPPVTALGPARGGARWLILDPFALEAMDPPLRRFWLASGLAHLQCGHGVFYTAHLLVKLGRAPRGIGLLRRALTPWSRVMAFSADRAGLLASEDLGQALGALEQLAARESEVAWLPRPPALDIRRIALEEFERSIVVARIRAARANQDSSMVSVVEEAPHGDEAAPPDESEAEATATEPEAEPPRGPTEPQVAHVPEDAWSIARCDRRLTERLGLL